MKFASTFSTFRSAPAAVGDSSVSGIITLATTRAAGALITLAAIRCPAMSENTPSNIFT